MQLMSGCKLIVQSKGNMWCPGVTAHFLWSVAFFFTFAKPCLQFYLYSSLPRLSRPSYSPFHRDAAVENFLRYIAVQFYQSIPNPPPLISILSSFVDSKKIFICNPVWPEYFGNYPYYGPNP